MQVRFKKSCQEASVLLITLAVLVIIGLGFASYLTLVQSQHRLVAESQAWNTALTLAEAGIEEGMGQINASFGTNYTGSTATNWGAPSGGVYGPKISTLTNGSYSAIIIQGTPSPTIIATGYAVVPFNSVPIQRVVQVTTTNRPAFGLAMGVQMDITTKGNNLTVDSYDSADPLHSTNGMYNAATHKAGGDIASVGGFVNIQNADIYGKLLTGPAGSYSIGNGFVGDLNWNVNGAIEPGWYRNDFNAVIRDVDPPYANGLPLVSVPIGTNTYILASGDYYVNGDFVLSQNETLYVSGNARLYVTGNINMKSQNSCFITIAPGASLVLYCGTTDGPAVSAQLTQVNTAGNASTFQYWGLPSNTAVTWNGNNSYVGTVYAPEAAFSMGGGGSSDFDYQGACVVYSASLNGHFNFHFDENLSRLGPPTGFSVISWREL